MGEGREQSSDVLHSGALFLAGHSVTWRTIYFEFE